MRADDSAGRWLRQLQRLAQGVAHQIRNPLNGAAVNLEVVRNRSARGIAHGNELAPFAQAAASEMERAVALVDALLAVSRAAPPAGEAGVIALTTVAQPLIILYDAIAAAEGGRVTLESSDDATTTVDDTSVRIAAAATLESIVQPGAEIRCRIERAGDRSALRLSALSAATGSPPEMPEGVRLDRGTDGYTLYFPAPERGNR